MNLTHLDLATGLTTLAVLVACAIGSAWLLQRRFFSAEERSERLTIVGTLAAIIALYPTLLLGMTGALRLAPLLVFLLAITLASFVLWRRAGRTRPAHAHATFGGRAALALFVLLCGFAIYAAGFGLVHPPLAWDDLFYHLPKVAQFYQDGAIAPLYHPQGPYPSYYPASTEALVLWAVLPFGNDLLVLWTNLPFLALAALALWRLARDAGAPPHLAALAPLCFVFTPCVARLAFTVHAEPLVIASALLTLHFALRAARSGEPRDAVLAGLAAGLLLGAKVTGPLYAALALLPWLIALRKAPRPLASVLALAVSAAPGLAWLAQNAILTGNPVYPLPIFGLPGIEHDLSLVSAGSRIAELLSEGHLFRALIGSDEPSVYQSGIGWKLVPLVVVFAWAMARARRAPERVTLAWLATLAFSWAALFLVAPVYFPANVYQNVRFLAPALALVVAAGVASLASRHPRVAAALAGASVASDLLAMARDATEALWLLTSIAAAAVLALATMRIARCVGDARRLAPAAAVVALAGLYAVLVPAHAARETTRHLRYARDWSTVQTVAPSYAPGWRFLDAHAAPDARVALHGFDFVYPIYGPALARRVRYIDVNARAGGAYHAYAGGANRTGADPAAWIQNLERFGANWLYLERRPWESRFPEERTWADARPARFTLRFANAWTRIYRVEASRQGGRETSAP
jgi:hypothetical protein